MCLLETTQAYSPIVWRGTQLKPINPPVKPAGRPPALGEEDHLYSALAIARLRREDNANLWGASGVDPFEASAIATEH
jgi:hypothetical protein